VFDETDSLPGASVPGRPTSSTFGTQPNLIRHLIRQEMASLGERVRGAAEDAHRRRTGQRAARARR
jgi:hypothetical protein